MITQDLIKRQTKTEKKMKEYIEKLRSELIKARNYIDKFPGEFYEGQQVVYDSLIDQLTEELDSTLNAPAPVIDLESKPVWVKGFEDAYGQWCKETKRNGSVLVGGSIQEFFEWLDETAQQAPEPVEELQGLKDENSHLKLVVDELSEQLEEKRNRIRELVDNRK